MTSVNPAHDAYFAHPRWSGDTLGARPFGDEGTFFRTWAPARRTVAVEIETSSGVSRVPLERVDDGFFERLVPGVRAGDHYRYVLDDRVARPDPASRCQPLDVHSWSSVVDPLAYSWRDHEWSGRARDEFVIYELHVGTFTEQGTFQAAITRLQELVDLGVTAVELMPITQSAGRWNWGYDGVQLFAVRQTYGTPDDFKAFVDACHGLGLAVIMDVVYNHLGPEGNYLADFGPFFSQQHHTPWGPAFNYDGKHSQVVRDWVIANALFWFAEYHIDGLRLDALHFMKDDSPVSIVAEMAQAVHHLGRELKRPLYLIGETNVHDANVLNPSEQEGMGLDAIWCDDLMHSILSISSSGKQLTYRVYHGVNDVAEALEHGFLYHGADYQRITERQAVPRADMSRLVVGLQNHDAVGNHPGGLRIHQLVSVEFQRAAAALAFLHPALPLLFMGEESSTPSPFLFFVDFADTHLRKVIADSRAREYAQHAWHDAVSPIEERAFRLSCQSSRESGDRRTWAWYQAILHLRHTWRSLEILSQDHLAVTEDRSAGLFVMHYRSPRTVPVFVAARLQAQNDSSASYRVKISGDVLLDSAARSPIDTLSLRSVANWSDAGLLHGAEPADYQMSPNQALIGRGTLAWGG